MKCVILAGAVCGLAGTAMAGMVGPSLYSSVASSPLTQIGPQVYVENFEDGQLNTPGVTASTGQVLTGSFWVDSVDGDDGFVDGTCAGGHSWFVANGATGVSFTFSPIFGGALPNWAGIVWTDGHNPIFFEAFDANGVSLGVVEGAHADELFTGSTEEDHFYGAYYESGISRITIRGTMGGLELDHLQYGFQPVPTPGALALLGLAGTLVRIRRR
ncbi:MAG: hypothetical protein SFY69_12365 [Planctomycetota bacterium]|nr:hypothetical protein [Planctomycetota bacterium]